jgi:hypothetical protein
VKPTTHQIALAKESHLPPTQEQARHAQTAARDPALSLTQSQGHPAVAATVRPAQLKGPGVVAARPGRPVLPAKPGVPSNGSNASTAPTPSNSGGASHALPGFAPPGRRHSAKRLTRLRNSQADARSGLCSASDWCPRASRRQCRRGGQAGRSRQVDYGCGRGVVPTLGGSTG